MSKNAAYALVLVVVGVYALGFVETAEARLIASLAAAGSILAVYRIAHKKPSVPVRPPPPTDTPSEFIAQENLHNEYSVSLQSLTREYRQTQRRELDDALSRSLWHALHTVRQAISCHTAAVFFVGRSGSVYLKAWSSNADDRIIPGAVVSKGKGLVGVMAKEAGTTKLENDYVANSQTLYYYSENVGIRSFMAVPMMVQNTFRGIVALDHTEPGAFKNSDLETLKEFSRVIGDLCLQSYLQLEHRIDRERISALMNMERDFLDLVRVREITDRLAQITGHAIEYDRLMIAMRENEDEAKVVLAEGEDSDFFRDFSFQTKETGVANLALLKNIPIQRQFDSDRYAPRFSPREKVNTLLRTILIEPLGSKASCLGVLTIESRNGDSYGRMDREILRNLTTAASVALEKAKNLETMQQLATRDGLTGLANHREFQNILSLELRAANRYSHSLGLVMMDIDHFKHVNDTYGHPAGDIVLKQVSQILQNNIRLGIDHVARYGGEEFALILHKADEKMMLETAERIRSLVEKTQINVGMAKTLSVTMSFGCALYPRNGRTQKEIIDRADKALYRAKQMGRNRVVKAM